MKKIICFLIIIVFIMLIGYNVKAYMSGDVDGNNTIGASDYVLVKKHILNTQVLSGDNLKRADVNADNNITSTDYIMIKKIILGNTVTIPVKEVSLNKTSITLDVGKEETLVVTINPSNATDKKITYTSSNSSVAKVDANGKVTAVAGGTATITASINNKTITSTITVNKLIGVVNGTGGIYGYTASDVATPTIANVDFFKKIAASGKGSMDGNTYVLNTSEGTYKYNANSGKLVFNNRTVQTLIFYPPSKDLSTVNTFTFFGGTGESNLGGYFNNIKKNPSKINSSGIIILVSYDGNRYYGTDGVYATNFVKHVVNQKSTCKNTVRGFSKGGPAAADAYELGNYSKVFILNSYFKDEGTRTKLRTAEIIFFITDQDGEYEYTIKGLNAARDYHYTNVTLISNYEKVNKQYKDYFLIYNPGSGMGSGHNYTNLINSNMFAYACS